MHGSHIENDTRTLFDRLIRLADEQGASQAVVIPTASIVVDDSLADLCRSPDCRVYGQAASCPPHVGGPSEFRKLLSHFERAIARMSPTSPGIRSARNHTKKAKDKVSASLVADGSAGRLKRTGVPPLLIHRNRADVISATAPTAQPTRRDSRLPSVRTVMSATR